MSFLRRHLAITITILGVLVIGVLYMYRSSLFPKGSFTQGFFSTTTLAGLKKEIISNDPLRALQNAPNAYLTRDGTISLTNNERTTRGLPALRENALLDKSADAKLADMFSKQYFEHESPTGAGPGTLADNVGYGYVVIGENLALGNYANDATLIKAWMDSPGHRANILNKDYQEIGVAVGKGMFQGEETWLAVQEFGKPASACPSIDESLKAKIDSEQNDLDSRDQDLQQRKAALNSEHPQTQEERDRYNDDVAEYNTEAKAYSAENAELQDDIETYNKQVRAYNACLGQ